jgi:hypothetical protein
MGEASVSSVDDAMRVCAEQSRLLVHAGDGWRLRPRPLGSRRFELAHGEHYLPGCVELIARLSHHHRELARAT